VTRAMAMVVGPLALVLAAAAGVALYLIRSKMASGPAKGHAPISVPLDDRGEPLA